MFAKRTTVLCGERKHNTTRHDTHSHVKQKQISINLHGIHFLQFNFIYFIRSGLFFSFHLTRFPVVVFFSMLLLLFPQLFRSIDISSKSLFKFSVGARMRQNERKIERKSAYKQSARVSECVCV